MENRGVVTSLEGQCALVEITPVSGGCGRCHEAGGCGSNLLNESLRPQRLNVYRLPNGIDAKVGDAVIISVAEGAVLRAALLAYLLPALFLIVGAAIGTQLAAPGSDGWALAGAGVGLGIGLLILRRVQSRRVGGAHVLAMRFVRADEAPRTCR